MSLFAITTHLWMYRYHHLVFQAPIKPLQKSRCLKFLYLAWYINAAVCLLTGKMKKAGKKFQQNERSACIRNAYVHLP